MPARRPRRLVPPSAAGHALTLVPLPGRHPLPDAPARAAALAARPAARLLWHHWRYLTGRPAMDEG